MRSPYSVDARAPTMATERLAPTRNGNTPRTSNAKGVAAPRSSSWVGHCGEPGKTIEVASSSSRCNTESISTTATRRAIASLMRDGPCPAKMRCTASWAPCSRTKTPKDFDPGSLACKSRTRARTSASSLMRPTCLRHLGIRRRWRRHQSLGGRARPSRPRSTPCAQHDQHRAP